MPEVELNKPIKVMTSAEATEQADQMWKLYPQYIFFEGPATDWYELLKSRFIEAKMASADMGYSEWYSQFGGEHVEEDDD